MGERAKRGEKWGRAKGRPVYDTMNTDVLANLPLERITTQDAVLLDWVTFPKMQEAIESVTYRKILTRRGIYKPLWEYKTVALVWVKTTPNAYENYKTFIRRMEVGLLTSEDLWKWMMGLPVEGIPRLWHFGSGYWTHGNVEVCLLYTKGKGASFRQSKAVSQLIFSPVRGHSEKPPQQYSKIDQLLGTDRPRIELFSRKQNPPPPNWRATGLQYDGMDICEGLGMPESYWARNRE